MTESDARHALLTAPLGLRLSRTLGLVLASITGALGILIGVSGLPDAIRYGFDPLLITFGFVFPLTLGIASIVVVLLKRSSGLVPSGRSRPMSAFLLVLGGTFLGFLAFSDSSFFLC